MAITGTTSPASLGRVVLRASLGWLAVAVLMILLGLPGGGGPEALLGLGGNDAAELAAMREAWSQLGLVAVGSLQGSLAVAALLYRVLDTALFIPLYGYLLFDLALRLAHVARRPLTVWLARLLPWLALLLLAADAVENASGLARLATGRRELAAAAVLVLLSVMVALWLWRRLGGAELFAAMAAKRTDWVHIQKRARWVLRLTAIAAALLLVAHALAPAAALSGGAAVHGLKLALLCVLLLMFAFVVLRWLLRQEGTDYDRGELRLGLADIFWRTRYVLATLAMLVALTLALDQCRDVAIGVADGLFEWPQALWAWPVMALSVIAVWALSFSCWLWTRLVCRMPSPGALASPPHPKVEAMLNSAARSTARVLGVLPAFVAALMSAFAARDAAWAASRDAAGWLVAPVALMMMGLACVLGGVLFLWGREQFASGGAGTVKDYYNDAALDQAHDWLERVAAEKYRFAAAWGPGPSTLPILALALAIALRCLAVAVEPDVPLAFPVIVFSLVGWLGFFGWLSMKEQRESRSWLLLLIAAAGLLGLFGFTDNHVVRVAREGYAAALPTVGWQLSGTVALATLVLVAAWVITHRGLWARWWQVLLGIGGTAVLLLAVIDRASVNDPTQRTSRATPPTLEQGFARWAEAAYRADPADLRVWLVASEGGGVRAAYWTASVLAELRRVEPRFDSRLLALSGVSGGAVGEAVFAACRAAGVDPQDCVQRFGRTDLLTPLLGAWMFEDLLARLLPSSLPGASPIYCLQPGCGFLSRGMWFEQALETAVPALKSGIVATGEQGPLLLLNATWVESGAGAARCRYSIPLAHASGWRSAQGSRRGIAATQKLASTWLWAAPGGGRSRSTIVTTVADGAILASASSGTVELSRQDFIELANVSPLDDISVEPLQSNGGVHCDLRIRLLDREVTFVNGGFPVNFDGRINCIPGRYIQPTPAMMVAATVQAAALLQTSRTGLIDLDPEFCAWVDREFRAELGEEAALLDDGAVPSRPRRRGEA